MMLSRHVLLGMVLASSVSAPALADDVVVGGKHCNTICQSWLGVKLGETSGASSRRIAESKPARTPPVTDPARARPAAKPVETQQPTAPAAPPGETQTSTRVDMPGQEDGTIADTPEAAEGSEPPQPGKLVAVRGSIMIQSASEKAADEQQKARLTKEMTRSAILP